MSKLVGYLAEEWPEDEIENNKIMMVRDNEKLKELKKGFFNKYRVSKINACPVGTVQIEDVCVKPGKIMPEQKDGCPGNMVIGRYIKDINVKNGMKKPLYFYLNNQKKFDDSADHLIEVDTVPVCIDRVPFPSNLKTIMTLVDEDLPCSWLEYNEVLDDIRSTSGLGNCEPGYAVCRREYNDSYCLLFKDKEDAKSAASALDWLNGDKGDIFDDTKKQLQDEFIEEKMETELPQSQRSLGEYAKINESRQQQWNRFAEKLKEKYKDEMEQEITEERIWDRVTHERDWFWQDINGSYPSYIGLHNKEEDIPVETPTGTFYPARTRQRGDSCAFVKPGDEL